MILLVAALFVSMLAIGVSAESTSVNEQDMYEFLTEEMGLNTAAACGIMGNSYYETGFRANIQVGNYFGLFMYYAPLTKSLKSWCSENNADYTTVNGQMRFLQAMFNGEVSLFNYTELYQTLLSIDNTPEGAYNAGSIFCKIFEKPGNVTYEANKRGTYAKETLFPKYKDHVSSSSVVTYTQTEVSFDGTINASSLNVRKGPGTSYGIMSTLSRNASVSVVAEALDTNGSVWYKLSVGGWISGAYLRKTDTAVQPKVEDTSSPDAADEGTPYIVTASALNVRSGAGTSNPIQYQVYKGNTVYVLEESSGWCRISTGGWVSKSYLTRDGGEGESAEEATAEAQGDAYIITASGLNVRSGAGTGYPTMKCLRKGTIVLVTETDLDGSGRTWGKLSSGGWICMAYTVAY